MIQVLLTQSMNCFFFTSHFPINNHIKSCCTSESIFFIRIRLDWIKLDQIRLESELHIVQLSIFSLCNYSWTENKKLALIQTTSSNLIVTRVVFLNNIQLYKCLAGPVGQHWPSDKAAHKTELAQNVSKEILSYCDLTRVPGTKGAVGPSQHTCLTHIISN